MTWTVDASGTQAATIGTEHVLDSPTTNGTYELAVDLSAMQLGDLVELRCYEMIDGVNYRQCFKGTFQHVPADPGKKSPPIVVVSSAKFTLKQVAGTGRSFPWSVRRI